MSWSDARDTKAEGEYRIRFTASLDGGASFLPSVVVSSATSRTLGAGNLTPSGASFVDRRGILRVAFLSAAGRWFNSGDYSGLAADRDGVFHPLWADSRDGTFQAWTARVHVTREPRVASISAGEPADVSKNVRIVADPAAYDPATKEMRVGLRLRNEGTTPLRPPITVEVLAFGNGPKGDVRRELAPEILNAPNGKTGAGALFDYSATLGDVGELPPGATSGAVVWHFRLKEPLDIPQMSVIVRGVSNR